MFFMLTEKEITDNNIQHMRSQGHRTQHTGDREKSCVVLSPVASVIPVTRQPVFIIFPDEIKVV